MRPLWERAPQLAGKVHDKQHASQTTTALGASMVCPASHVATNRGIQTDRRERPGDCSHPKSKISRKPKGWILHKHIYIYMYTTYIIICTCECVREREGERHTQRQRKGQRQRESEARDARHGPCGCEVYLKPCNPKQSCGSQKKSWPASQELAHSESCVGSGAR